MQRTLMDAHVIHPDELAAAVAALLAGGAPNQKVINAHVDPAVERFCGLEDDAQVAFRDTLVGLRARVRVPGPGDVLDRPGA